MGTVKVGDIYKQVNCSEIPYFIVERIEKGIAYCYVTQHYDTWKKLPHEKTLFGFELDGGRVVYQGKRFYDNYVDLSKNYRVDSVEKISDNRESIWSL